MHSDLCVFGGRGSESEESFVAKASAFLLAPSSKGVGLHRGRVSGKQSMQSRLEPELLVAQGKFCLPTHTLSCHAVPQREGTWDLLLETPQSRMPIIDQQKGVDTV